MSDRDSDQKMETSQEITQLSFVFEGCCTIDERRMRTIDLIDYEAKYRSDPEMKQIGEDFSNVDQAYLIASYEKVWWKIPINDNK